MDKAEPLGNGPLRLASGQNNPLNSFRNGPIKAAFDPTKIREKRDTSPITKGKPPLQKKPRHCGGKYARPASPGIHGMVAEPTYKNTIKNYTANKGKTAPSPRQQMIAQTTIKNNGNNMSMRGISPSKPTWKN